jgi:hypothetical protein
MARGSNMTVAQGPHESRVMRKVANIEAAEIEDTTAALWWELQGGQGA